MVNFGEFLKTWSLRSNSVTKQVTFNRTKIGVKCQNWKIKSATFWVIFKHYDINRRADHWLLTELKQTFHLSIKYKLIFWLYSVMTRRFFLQIHLLGHWIFIGCKAAAMLWSTGPLFYYWTLMRDVQQNNEVDKFCWIQLIRVFI